MQGELAESLGVNDRTVSKRLEALGNTQKWGHWVPYELKSKDVERRLAMCEQLLQRQKKKRFFFHRIVTGDKKWIYYKNPKHRSFTSTSTSTAKLNIHGSKFLLCIWSDQLNVVYKELLILTEIITGDLYRLQVMRLCRALTKKRSLYKLRYNKVILQRDNAWLHVAERVKTCLETL